jgi:1-phosphofructokinase family hexose kinase
MIYTLTLNPALDITITTTLIDRESINRTKLKSVSAGGKGFNASRALDCLGIDNTAIAFCGGFFNHDMEILLKKEKIKTILLSIKDSIRVNIKIIENNSRKLIEFNESGPSITVKEIGTLISVLENLRPLPDYLIISGSLPKNIDIKIYRKIIDILKTKKVKTLLDASGRALYYGLLAFPDIVKINKNEFDEICKKYFKKESKKLVADLINKGVEMVMVTDGPRETTYFDRSGTYIITPSDKSGPYKTGSGDAVNAGLIYSLKNDYNLEKRLAFAVACGNANILSEIPGKFNPGIARDLAQDIRIRYTGLAE